MFRRVWIDETVAVATRAQTLDALLRDIERWPVWTSGLRAIRRADPTAPIAVGTRFTMVLDPGVPLPCTVYAYGPERIEWGGGLGPWMVRHRFEITPIDDERCRLRQLEYATGLLALLAMPLEKQLRRHDHRWMETIVSRFAPRSPHATTP